ncbi:nitrogenase component 1 [Rubrobacter calidifluminis]|uniref:nitrogenase component 1 n=1 Tax=Rubrobacter calidifluminis TaxID=1392640 RepID=UPI00235E055A|nr:nitrogenase component 1 [Rubrobacter calidifluminis]
MTILDEAGIPDVLSPLCGLRSLSGQLPDVLIVLVGTRSEVHLSRLLPGALTSDYSPGERVRFILLDPETKVRQGSVASGVAEAADGLRGIAAVFVVCGRTARYLGVDPAFEARLAERRLGVPVRSVGLEPEGPRVLSTDLEDRVLAALVSLCPAATAENPAPPPPKGSTGRLFGNLFVTGRVQRQARERPRRVVLLGAGVPPRAWQELASEFDRLGIEVAGGLPGLGAASLPALGEGVVAAVCSPYLPTAARAAAERGVLVVRSLVPIGIGGTSRFLQDVALAAGLEAERTSRPNSAHEELESLRSRIRGKRIFFAGDTGLELPLARFLADAGAVIVEVGVPRLDRRVLSAEIQALGGEVDVVEAPDPEGQMERIERSHPDIVVASAGLYVPLTARGWLCCLSTELVQLGVYGYAGARRVLGFFCDILDRAGDLDSIKL